MGWKKLSSTVVYENDWMRVHEDDVINPGGGKNRYGHVRFKNIAVAILPIDEHGNTWLVGQERYTLGEYSWELPMGGCPEGEEPLLAAQRELSEETGLTANVWTEVLRLHPSNSITDELGIAYRAEGLTPGPTCFEEAEELSLRVVPIDEAVRMARDGEITDAITVATLFHFALQRASGSQ